jgi:hypothetical protein
VLGTVIHADLRACQNDVRPWKCVCVLFCLLPFIRVNLLATMCASVLRVRVLRDCELAWIGTGVLASRRACLQACLHACVQAFMRDCVLACMCASLLYLRLASVEACLIESELACGRSPCKHARVQTFLSADVLT